MATTKITDGSFEAEVLKNESPVLVDFWAEWCGPCRALGPKLEELSDELGEKIKIVKLNIDENPNIDIAEKEEVFAKIDKLEKDRDEKLEEVLVVLRPKIQTFASQQ